MVASVKLDFFFWNSEIALAHFGTPRAYAPSFLNMCKQSLKCHKIGQKNSSRRSLHSMDSKVVSTIFFVLCVKNINLY
jgi:hypothetical protein